VCRIMLQRLLFLFRVQGVKNICPLNFSNEVIGSVFAPLIMKLIPCSIVLIRSGSLYKGISHDIIIIISVVQALLKACSASSFKIINIKFKLFSPFFTWGSLVSSASGFVVCQYRLSCSTLPRCYSHYVR
jgi:glucan phosphoethanolaminetransferase (alkaline phosphatase superfamily)